MTNQKKRPLLDGVRVIESSLLGPAAIGVHLADLGAEVIKVESPAGDYVREMTWPIIQGTSLIHLHINRGKKSVVLDLRKPEGVAVYKELVKKADVVIEAMRPGALARLGLGYDVLKAVNPQIVFCTLSGYGSTGPYRDLPSHGIAYDTWAGIVGPAYDDNAFCYIPEHASIGIHAGPIFGAIAILAALVSARATGEGSQLELAQSDAAAYMDWYRIESYLAYERPTTEVTGNKTDDYVRRAPGTAGMKEGVRYQLYESSDGHVLFMASEQAFWKNFCDAIERSDLFAKWPGKRFADHAPGNLELRTTLRAIFKTRSSAEWIALGNAKNFPIAPVNTPESIASDPQFRDRFALLPHVSHGADMLPFPVKLLDRDGVTPAHAPVLGEHTDAVLKETLKYSDTELQALRDRGVLG
jgi:crotonobetainyl-CoA:carnitine CoA-transferase CaiB-like acyl-CoA transferase